MRARAEVGRLLLSHALLLCCMHDYEGGRTALKVCFEHGRTQGYAGGGGEEDMLLEMLEAWVSAFLP